MVDADQGTEQHAAGRGHARAHGKDARMHPWHRNTHGLGHYAVLSGGPDPDAVAAIFEEQVEPADHGRGQAGDQEAIPWVLQVKQAELAAEGLLDLACDRSELP